MAVLTLNAGSSSLKFAVFGGEHAILRGAFEDIAEAPKARAAGADGAAIEPPAIRGTGQEALLSALFAWLPAHLGDRTLEAVAHRIVHGGDRFAGPVLIDDEVLAAIEALSPLAPLHQPHGIAAIRAAQKAEPGLPQIACFDTAFHQTMPPIARLQALPERIGLRRYGFHGLSYAWIAGKLSPRLAAGRTVAAHLGSGASLCALLGGRSIETTMATTPLDGLPMGTRSGALDPGLLLYLQQARGMTVGELEHLLYHESGLLGVSGISADLRTLRESKASQAALAIDLFAYRIAQSVGALAASLGGLDGLVFTGGIGEHDAALRQAVCARLVWAGVALDASKPAPGRISSDEGEAEIWVIAADEEAVLARQAQIILDFR